MYTDFTCQHCDKDCLIAPDPPARAICPSCCDKSKDGHTFEYDKWERHWLCKVCGERASDDYLSVD